MKLSEILLLGVLGAGLTVSGNSVYGQLNKEYNQQLNAQSRCINNFNAAQYNELEPNVKYVRTLVVDGKVWDIINNGIPGQCKSEFEGYIDKDYTVCSKYGWGCTVYYFTFKSGKLVKYTKDKGQVRRWVYNTIK